MYLTLCIPWMILGETSLSFLDLGVRPLLGRTAEGGENIRILAHAPCLLIPACSW